MPQSEYFSVRFRDRQAIISVVTAAYRGKLGDSSPPFYNHYIFESFHSDRTLAELNASLGSDGLLSNAEAEHLRAHLQILNLYRERQWPPLPPHLLLRENASLYGDLAGPMRRLEAAAEAYVLETKG